MNSISILFGGNLAVEAYKPLLNGKNSIYTAASQAQKFPGVIKTVLLADKGDFSFLDGVQIEFGEWTKRSLLDKIAELQDGFDFAYFAFADCPFLDPSLADALSQRHTRYAAEYSYADGFPFGLAPEILSPGTAAILSKILSGSSSVGADDGEIERDFLFSVIQKDINAFDIETEISGVDLRCHRLNLCADSKRNFLLLNNFINASNGSLPSAPDIEKIIEMRPQILRTLPAFYPVQVFGGCPQKCALCPYPLITNAPSRKDFMAVSDFEYLLEKIAGFSGDAVIDLSLWGELGIHPEKLKLIEKTFSHNGLSLVIETSGIGWKTDELEKCAGFKGRLSWIVSLDTADPQKYAALRESGFAEAQNCAKKLLELFPKNSYVQAVRTKGSEDDIEKFYRYWKEHSPNGDKNIIIQKYDDFCGKLEKKQASDISPVVRQSCWHIMRDMPVLIDGSVPLCKEDLENKRLLGNAFKDSLESIWKNGETYYNEHCEKNYTQDCADCDEYYTYNF